MQQTLEMQVANARHAGEGEVAVREWRERVSRNPGDLDARMKLASWYESGGAIELALEHVRQARLASPDDAALVLEEARLLRRLHLRESSAQVLNAFIKTHQDAPASVHGWLGIDLDSLGQHAAAERAHRAAAAAAPASAIWQNNLGYNLHLQGREEDAARALQSALRLDPQSEFARNNLLLASAGQSTSAGNAAAHNNRAAAYIEQGKYGEARRELSLALTRDRAFGPALANLKLVSELDGNAPSVALSARDAWYRRFGHTMRVVFVGEWDTPPKSAPPGGANN